MAYSSITKKKCKGNCNRYPVMGLDGWCWSCVPEEIKIKVGNKRRLAQKKKNSRLSQVAKLRTAQKELTGENELDLWYLARKYEMVDRCTEPGCTKRTNKFSEKYYRWSVCHIVPKSLVPSVATHFYNFVELCQDHHNEYDSTFDKAKNLKCFPEIKRRFGLFQHLIPADELRKVNPFLL